MENEKHQSSASNDLLACAAWHKRHAEQYRHLAEDFDAGQSGRAIMAKYEWLAAAERHEHFAQIIEAAAG